MGMNEDSDSTDNLSGPFTDLCAHLDEREIKYASHPKKKLISLTMVGDHVVKSCKLRITHNDSLLELFISYPVYAKPEHARVSVTEFLTRANYGLNLGAFEMDLSDGEIRFRASHIIHEGELPSEVFLRLFFTSLKTSERYFPALMQLLFGGLTPADAVYMAELDLAVDQIETETPKKKTGSQKTGGSTRPDSSKKPGKKPPTQPPVTPPPSGVIPEADEDEEEKRG
jgi:hypothetical protein